MYATIFKFPRGFKSFEWVRWLTFFYPDSEINEINEDWLQFQICCNKSVPLKIHFYWFAFWCWACHFHYCLQILHPAVWEDSWLKLHFSLKISLFLYSPARASLCKFEVFFCRLYVPWSYWVSSELFAGVRAASAGCPLHLAVYRHVFSAPGAQAQMCIPTDKASIFRPLSLICLTGKFSSMVDFYLNRLWCI